MTQDKADMIEREVKRVLSVLEPAGHVILLVIDPAGPAPPLTVSTFTDPTSTAAVLRSMADSIDKHYTPGGCKEGSSCVDPDCRLAHPAEPS